MQWGAIEGVLRYTKLTEAWVNKNVNINKFLEKTLSIIEAIKSA
jgi:hypothetical protein